MTATAVFSSAAGALRPLSRGLVAALLAVSLAACAGPDGRISKQTVGAGVGAGAGVAVGSLIGAGGGRTAAMIVGGLLGALIGSEIGRTMDENDRLRHEAAVRETLETYPSGQVNSWNNPDTGYAGQVTAGPTYPDRPTCRPYTQTITVDGRSETAEGVACRNPDGTWRIVNG